MCCLCPQAPLKPPVDMRGCIVHKKHEGGREPDPAPAPGPAGDAGGAAQFNFGFEVQGAGRRWRLWASSKEDRAKWVSAFERAGVSSPSASSVESSDSLHTDREGGGRGGGAKVTRQNSIRLTRGTLARQGSLVGAALVTQGSAAEVRRAGSLQVSRDQVSERGRPPTTGCLAPSPSVALSILCFQQ